MHTPTFIQQFGYLNIEILFFYQVLCKNII